MASFASDVAAYVDFDKTSLLGEFFWT